MRRGTREPNGGGTAGWRPFETSFCRRCGREFLSAWSDPGDVPLCAGCGRADRGRYLGLSAHDYSPFRPLLARRDGTGLIGGGR